MPMPRLELAYFTCESATVPTHFLPANVGTPMK